MCSSQRHPPCWRLSPPPPAVVAGAPVVSASPQASAGPAPPEAAFLPETHGVTRPLSSLHFLEHPLPTSVGCAVWNGLRRAEQSLLMGAGAQDHRPLPPAMASPTSHSLSESSSAIWFCSPFSLRLELPEPTAGVRLNALLCNQMRRLAEARLFCFCTYFMNCSKETIIQTIVYTGSLWCIPIA